MTHEDIELLTQAGFHIAASNPTPIYRVLAVSERRDQTGILQTKVVDVTEQIETLLALLGRQAVLPEPPQRYTPELSSQWKTGVGYEGEVVPCVQMRPDPQGEYVKYH